MKRRSLRLTEEQFAKIDRRMRQLWKLPEPPTIAPPPAPKRVKVDYARELARQIREAKLPEPQLEFAFAAQLEGSGRGWRFDLAWREVSLAVEIDGAVHRIKERFKADLPKQQEAFALGYKLLRVSPQQVRNGEALELVRKALT